MFGMLLLTLLLAYVNTVVTGDAQSVPTTTWQEFVSEMLAKDKVEYLVVRRDVRPTVSVYLKPAQTPSASSTLKSKSQTTQTNGTNVENNPDLHYDNSYNTKSHGKADHGWGSHVDDHASVHSNSGLSKNSDKDFKNSHSMSGRNNNANNPNYHYNDDHYNYYEKTSSSNPSSSVSWDEIHNRQKASEPTPAIPHPVHNRKANFSFEVPDLENFETKLASVQTDLLQLPPSQHVPVYYVDKSQEFYEDLWGLLAIGAVFSLFYFLKRRVKIVVISSKSKNPSSSKNSSSSSTTPPNSAESPFESLRRDLDSSNIFNFNKMKVNVVLPNDPRAKVRFSDVAGLSEVKEEVTEYVSILKDPSKYQAIGAKVPKVSFLIFFFFFFHNKKKMFFIYLFSCCCYL